MLLEAPFISKQAVRVYSPSWREFCVTLWGALSTNYACWVEHCFVIWVVHFCGTLPINVTVDDKRQIDLKSFDYTSIDRVVVVGNALYHHFCTSSTSSQLIILSVPSCLIMKVTFFTWSPSSWSGCQVGPYRLLKKHMIPPEYDQGSRPSIATLHFGRFCSF